MTFFFIAVWYRQCDRICSLFIFWYFSLHLRNSWSRFLTHTSLWSDMTEKKSIQNEVPLLSNDCCWDVPCVCEVLSLWLGKVDLHHLPCWWCSTSKYRIQTFCTSFSSHFLVNGILWNFRMWVKNCRSFTLLSFGWFFFFFAWSQVQSLGLACPHQAGLKVSLRGSVDPELEQNLYSKVVHRRTSVGRTQAGDVLIISKTGEARLCSYCSMSMFSFGQL